MYDSLIIIWFKTNCMNISEHTNNFIQEMKRRNYSKNTIDNYVSSLITVIIPCWFAPLLEAVRGFLIIKGSTYIGTTLFIHYVCIDFLPERWWTYFTGFYGWIFSPVLVGQNPGEYRSYCTKNNLPCFTWYDSLWY